MSKKSKYPEHTKLKKISKLSQAIGQFIDHAKTIRQGERSPRMRLFGAWRYKGTEAILSEYFDIDPQKLNDEKVAMLKELRGEG